MIVQAVKPIAHKGKVYKRSSKLPIRYEVGSTLQRYRQSEFRSVAIEVMANHIRWDRVIRRYLTGEET